MVGFFELRTAADLREKLRRDFARVQASSLDVDTLFNFLVTAEHMADWVLPGKVNREARKALRNGSVVLQVCSHLANGAKHYRIEAGHHQSVDQTLQSDENTQRFLAPRSRPTALVIVLQERVAQVLGQRILAIQFAEQVLDFWDAYPLE